MTATTALSRALPDFTSQQTNLLLISPLFRLEASKNSYTDEEGNPLLEGLDTYYLCLAALYRVMEGEAGMKCYTREEVKHYLANIAQTIKPALSDENGNRVADIVIDTLDNARNSYVMFSYTYFHAPTGTTRQKDFRLVNYDDVDDRRCILPTHEGYQVLMGTLDVPLEEKQILAQRMLTLLLERGHFQQALEVARDVWMKASEYRNHIRALLDNALRSPGTVNWEQSLLPYLEAASKHIDEAQNNLQHINDVIADKRSQAKGDNRVALANTKDWAEKALRIRAVLLEEIHAAPEQFKKAQALIFRMRAPSGLPDPDKLLEQVFALPVSRLREKADDLILNVFPAVAPKAPDVTNLLDLLLTTRASNDPTGGEYGVGEIVPFTPPPTPFPQEMVGRVHQWLAERFSEERSWTLSELLLLSRDAGFSWRERQCVVYALYGSFPESESLFPHMASSVQGILENDVAYGDDLLFVQRER